MEYEKLFARKVVLDWAKMKHEEYQQSGVASITSERLMMGVDFTKFVEMLLHEFQEFLSLVSIKNRQYMDEKKAIEEMLKG